MESSLGTSVTHPYTCLSCSLAFTNATFQREHYGTDLHRYNSKRRVAGLMPISIELYDEKVSDRRVVEEEDLGRLSCKACNKNFNTIATQNTHNISRRHKEMVFRAVNNLKLNDLSPSLSPEAEIEPVVQLQEKNETDADMEIALQQATLVEAEPVPSGSTSTLPAPVEPTLESSGDPKLDLLIAKRILASPPIAPTTCLFCPHTSTSAQETATHMRAMHSFVIPEQEYLVDLEGLLRRLGEEVGTWNVCICCAKGYGGNVNLDTEGMSTADLAKRASKGVEAVRKHMKDKSHCRLPYETESQRLELADFYDFRSSYPDYVPKKQRKALLKNSDGSAAAGEGWEDEAGNGDDVDEEGLEVVYEESDSEDSDDELPESDITYGDSPYELVLASGARIAHRAHKHIHKQNLTPYLGANPFTPSAHSSPNTAFKPSPHSMALMSLVPTHMQSDKSHARPLHTQGLIPARGAGFGGNGDVIRAKNKGEAKNAGKHIRQFRELKEFNKQSFIRGVRANSQEHYRDHLLQ